MTTTMKFARKTHRSIFTKVIEEKDGTTKRVRQQFYVSFRHWIRAEHKSNPVVAPCPKLRRILGGVP